MAETLFHAYAPLILWTGLGILLLRWVPQAFPRLLGRSLYWVGVPLEIFALARKTSFSGNVGMAPILTMVAIILGLTLAWGSLQGLSWLSEQAGTPPTASESTDIPHRINLGDRWLQLRKLLTFPLDAPRRGGFILSAVLGNTGFVGLAIVPTLISDAYSSWAVFYSVTQNVLGTYGIGVFLASYYGRSQTETNHWWIQLRDVLSVPSLWAFVLGSSTRSVFLPDAIESGLQGSVWVVIPSAFLLMGMRLSQLHGIKSLRLALVPVILKAIAVPGLLGLLMTLLDITGEPRLAMVLMAGMPSAFAGLILAEEYDLDRELIASSIALTTVALLLMIPCWLYLFGT